ncbi:efflux RND transporter permease subunit [Catalinimonas niigatensis]|uniref:efflux RND transporter permease subunit n=1 Tax=Catalinimonas niigatensis TaxID=1397264 RepID=UPI002666CBA4|nr:efflux RND transporter permease subunit [Catalinimonas niigatensis]WPP52011.1 efflux RND transporter permease subunit [Catalinimonas niigatensis]
MKLSDISVKRPVFAAVLSLLILAFGLVCYTRLVVREYPDIEPPIVSVETNYLGASAAVVETRITQLIEQRVSEVEAIKLINSSSVDGRSEVTIEFDLSRDIDAAANDVREAVSNLLDNLPEEADPPEINKVDAGSDAVLYLNLTSTEMGMLELTDYADRYLVDRFSVLPGVARVRISGGSRYAMRIWINREALAARQLTVTDVEDALRSENVELPAGSLESVDRQFTVRLNREFQKVEDFNKLIIKRDANGHHILLEEVAKVRLGPEEHRMSYTGNGIKRIGLGIIKQSKSNTLDIAGAVKEEVEKIKPTLPDHMSISNSYDRSLFIAEAITEVYKTLGIAIILVVFVIYVFLGDIRATIIPAVTVPVSLVGTCIVLLMFGYSLNLLTLLALVLAIGLVVDDAIVVLENIYSRLETGANPLVAAYQGAREVGFAVIATSLVLLAVFIPITFLAGDIGKLFTEFAIAMAAAVFFSTLVALSLSPMLCSKMLKYRKDRGNFLTRGIDRSVQYLQRIYRRTLERFITQPIISVVIIILFMAGSVGLFLIVPQEFTPQEDRGVFFIGGLAPEGSTYSYTKSYMDEIEKRLMYLHDETGEAGTILVRTPQSFGSTVQSFNDGRAIIVLSDFSERRSAWEIMDEVREKLSDLTGLQISIIMRQGLSTGSGKPVQYVLSGDTYEEIAAWRDELLDEIKGYPGLTDIDYDYKETKPQLKVNIDKPRAAELGVSIINIGRTLETLLGSRLVTTFIQGGEEYDVIVESDFDQKRMLYDLKNIFVRSSRSGELIPLSNLVTLDEFADSGSLNRYNRMRAITIEANLANGYTLGQALDYLDAVVAENLPEEVNIGYKGESLDYKDSGESVIFIFLLALIVVYLVLAAQFESFVHPFVLILTVPFALLGALLGLWLFGQSVNIYSQIGMIMLVGLATKNGILIVEFINQLRDRGQDFESAIIDASVMRLRPILMTGLTTIMGSLPLIISFGAGSETRLVIGIAVSFGVLVSSIFTIYTVPAMYKLIAKGTSSPNAVANELEKSLNEEKLNPA